MKRQEFNSLVETYIGEETGTQQAQRPCLSHYSEAELVYKGVTVRRSSKTGEYGQLAIFLVMHADQNGASYHVLHADTTDIGGLMAPTVNANNVITTERGHHIPTGFPEGGVFIPTTGTDRRLRLGGQILQTEYSAFHQDPQLDELQSVPLSADVGLCSNPTLQGQDYRQLIGAAV